MTTKTYSTRSNCAAAARAKLGKAAKIDVDFIVTRHEDGRFSWHAKAAEKKRRASGERAKLVEQPQMAKIISLCSQHPRTVEGLAKALGDVQHHTVRGMLSRLSAAGVPFAKERDGRNVKYSVVP